MLHDNYDEKKPSYHCQQTVLFIVSINTPRYGFLMVTIDCLFSNHTTSFHREIYSQVRQSMTHNLSSLSAVSLNVSSCLPFLECLIILFSKTVTDMPFKVILSIVNIQWYCRQLLQNNTILG